MAGNVVSLPANRSNRDPAMDTAIAEIRAHLREYLEMQGVAFDSRRRDQFHCFNKAAHANGDRDASASLDPHKDRKSFKCHACGISGDIFDACYLLEGREKTGKEFVSTARYLAGLFSISFPEVSAEGKRKSDNNMKPFVVAEYTYTDENGAYLYRAQRLNYTRYGQLVKTDLGKPKKSFNIQSYDGNDSWKNGYDKTAKRVLYHLPAVLKAIHSGETIFFVEGEKCADIIVNELKLPATTIVGGSNAWISPHTQNYIRDLIGAKLVIIIDNDTAGRRFGDAIANDVVAVASSLKLVSLPGLPAKGDIEEWCQLHPDTARQDFLTHVDSVKEWKRDREKTLQEYLEPIQIKDGMYIKPGDLKHPPMPISNFTVHPLHKTIPDGVPANSALVEWLVRVEIAGGRSFEQTITLEAFINRTKFRAAFLHEGMSFTGSDDELQAVKLLMGKEPHEIRRGVQYIGFHLDQQDEQELFVSHTRAIHADGAEADNVRLMDGSLQITTDILDTATASPDELPALVKALFGFNTLDKCAIIMGWVAGCFIKEKLRATGIKFPHLFIYGEAGSGKSQTVESIIMPLFNTEKKFSAGQLTDFVTFRVSSSSNAIPFVIDEYKPFAIGETRVKRISELLRNTYDQQDVGRGHKDLGVSYYRYRAPVCLVGEEGTDETANKERGLELLFSKMSLLQNGHNESFLYLKENRQAIRRLGRSILATAMTMDSDDISAYHCFILNEIIPKVKSRMPGMPDRVAESVGCCLTGLMLLDATLQECGGLEDITGYSTEDLQDAILNAVYENIMDGQGTPKAAVDHILEAMSRMAAASLFYEGRHYQRVNNDSELALDISLMYDEFKKYRRDHDLKCESLEQNQFTKQLRHKLYFTDYRTVKFKGDYAGSSAKVKRAFILNKENLLSEVDALGFFHEQT